MCACNAVPKFGDPTDTTRTAEIFVRFTTYPEAKTTAATSPHADRRHKTALLTPALTSQYANQTRQFNSSLAGHILHTQCKHHHGTLCWKISTVCNFACLCANEMHMFRKNNEQNTLFMRKPPSVCIASQTETCFGSQRTICKQSQNHGVKCT
jgi:hypothetical protein